MLRGPSEPGQATLSGSSIINYTKSPPEWSDCDYVAWQTWRCYPFTRKPGLPWQQQLQRCQKYFVVWKLNLFSKRLRKEYALNVKAVRKPQAILSCSPRGKNKFGGQKLHKVSGEFPLSWCFAPRLLRNGPSIKFLFVENIFHKLYLFLNTLTSKYTGGFEDLCRGAFCRDHNSEAEILWTWHTDTIQTYIQRRMLKKPAPP